jgi:FAD/FMN-containing dehydrogenase/Fe-S oxidoreductase
MSLPPDFVNELRKHSAGEIRTDLASRILYSTDASIYQIEPLGIVIPRTQDDLQSAVELAAKYKIPTLPRGAGTSLAGQAIGEALILDCSRWLDQIVEINPEEHYAIVEPGVVLSNLNNAVAKHGLQYGPDPASAERATMGGVIANNATGAHSILYGMSADHLVAADVILGDGTFETWDEHGRSKLLPAIQLVRKQYGNAIKQNLPKTWRNSAGYRLNYLLPWSPSAPPQWGQLHRSLITDDRSLPTDNYPPVKLETLNLATLLAGSEGTLALIRRMKVNLVPKPAYTILAVLSYQSIADACDDVPRLLTHYPSAVELIPQTILRLARSIPAYARQMGWVAGDPSALLVVEFSGDNPKVLRDSALRLNDVLTIAESKEDQARIWNIRKVGLGLLDSRPQSARPIAFIEDCAIPVDRLGEFVREVEKILSAHGTYGGFYAHASAGCLHIRPVLDLKLGGGVRSMRSIAEATLSVTLRLGGSMSSEHGDGLARSEFLEQIYGTALMDAMRQIKDAADPYDILNPGKIIKPQKMDVNLRYGPEYRERAWTPNLSFERNGGLALAIEQCNGQGVCRKDTGMMCPSYQATREEQNSTRGRANLLRAFIAHPSSVNRKSEIENEVAQALDLCLACKGCKAECPSGVDMAKLKYEFEHQYFRRHRRPLRDYVFGYFHAVAAVASSFVPVSNALMADPFIKKISAIVLGITNERPFPRFARLGARVRPAAQARDRGENVIFLSDPFSRYVEPHVEQAAFDLLAECGYSVRPLHIIGSGALLLSKGFVDAARRHAGKVLDALNQLDPTREASIVGIEPPEIYSLKGDYYDLLPERKDEITQRGKKVWLLDEFLIRSDEFENLRVANNIQAVNPKDFQPAKKIYFHPHCHQQAEGFAFDGLPCGTGSTVRLLNICGYQVELTDAGCCGMAGTFGYEAEHYDLSQKIGGLRLFPFLKQSKVLEGNASIVSTGAACRMQIRQGTGMEVFHPIELVARLSREAAQSQS